MTRGGWEQRHEAQTRFHGEEQTQFHGTWNKEHARLHDGMSFFSPDLRALVRALGEQLADPHRGLGFGGLQLLARVAQLAERREVALALLRQLVLVPA